LSISSKIKQHLPHEELSVKLWEDQKLKPSIREQLLEISEAFMKYLGISIDVIDVTFTGSYANYNYTPYSDIDLHIIVDPKSINRDIDLVEEFLKAKRQFWNDRHDIRVLNIEVELYAQDVNEPHESSGVYSVKKDEWINKPNKFRVEFDSRNITRKVKYFTKLIIMEINEAKMSRDIAGLEKLIKKIRNMRQSGLEKGGEMSDENIIYKILRSEGNIQKLYDMKDNIFDVDLSL
jgi:predicted nucleotidyltransferase|tara:strand:- start:304 stop:1008 length:705 start_codon:yes stop_codon:yes gene_type:complete